MIASLALILILATEPVGEQTPDQFDLICTGNRTKILVDRINGVEPFQSELRIDLRAKTWCGGDCVRAYNIDGSVTASEITLTDDSQGPWESHTQVDRTTGKFTSSTYYTANGLKSGGHSDGECLLAPFKGIPVPAF